MGLYPAALPWFHDRRRCRRSSRNWLAFRAAVAGMALRDRLA